MTARRLVLPLLAVLAAALGAAAGQLATSRRASACKCPIPEWRVTRQSVSVSDPAAASHQSYWPPGGRLTSYTGRASIWADQLMTSLIGYVTAAAPRGGDAGP
jgi:hypothetical protein